MGLNKGFFYRGRYSFKKGGVWAGISNNRPAGFSSGNCFLIHFFTHSFIHLFIQTQERRLFEYRVYTVFSLQFLEELGRKYVFLCTHQMSRGNKEFANLRFGDME